MANIRDRKPFTTTQTSADLLRPSDIDYPGVFLRATEPRPQEAPPLANDDNYVTTDVTVLTDNLLSNDTPGDVPLTVTAVNGNAAAVGVTITLNSGATLRVNADGTFVYNANGAFNSVPTTNDIFTYTVAGGDTATVTIEVQDPPAATNGTGGPDVLNGTPGGDVINGLAGDDTINGLGGDDVLDGGADVDAMTGGTGNDVYYVDNAADTIVELDGEGYDIVIATANYTLAAGAYVEELSAVATHATGLTLTGNDLGQIIRGGNAADTLIGGAGNDEFDGRGGLDVYHGGAGDDIYYVTIDTIVEAAGNGYDIAYVIGAGGTVSYTIANGAEVELLALAPNTSVTLGVTFVGNSFGQEIRGSTANDTLRGGGGADTLVGFAGNDNYTVDSTDDVVIETGNAGYDRILTSVNWTLADADSIEELVGTGSAGLTLTGNSSDNYISGTTGGDTITGNGGHDSLFGAVGADNLYGGAGNDVLNGGTEADYMEGGLGNDAYHVDNALDVVVEDTDEAGQTPFAGDSLSTSISYTLAANQFIEMMFATEGGISLTGNGIAQRITGSSSNNILIGLGGDDIIVGGGGNDTMDGGLGDDTFYVDSAADAIVERVGEGRDTVYTTVSYVLASGVHVEALSVAESSTTTPLNLTGNAFAQEIYGNNGDNVLNGGGGQDFMIGYGGDDTYYVQSGVETIAENAGQGRDVVYTFQTYAINAGASVEVLSAQSIASTNAMNLTGNELAQEIYGNNGDNVLIGGGGQDFMIGFGGDDTYYVQSGTETIAENAGQGRDVVYTFQTYALTAGASVEVLSAQSIASTNAMNLTGNELAQEIYGNNGNNVLIGGGGADFIIGFGGDDTYYVHSGTETFAENEGQGRDVVNTLQSYTLAAGASMEVLAAQSFADTAAISLTGNELGQEIYGNAGANVLDGKAGNDALIGNGGADTFAFTTALGATNVDAILDFATTVDKIGLDDAIFSGIGTPGAFNANAFRAGSAAADADDRIIYNQATGQLFYDADGNGAGAQVLFATLNPGTALVVGDFSVI